jgi:hypothetical protein
MSSISIIGTGNIPRTTGDYRVTIKEARSLGTSSRSPRGDPG